MKSERGTRHDMAHQEFVHFSKKNPATYANDTCSFLQTQWCPEDRRNRERKMGAGKDREGRWNGL